MPIKNVTMCETRADADKHAAIREMPVFNDCAHTFIELEPGKMHTFSVDFMGEKVTMCFIPRDDGSPECVDIAHKNGDKMPAWRVRNADQHRQNWVLFNGGTNSFRTEGDEEKACTLAALLLHPDYRK